MLPCARGWTQVCSPSTAIPIPNSLENALSTLDHLANYLAIKPKIDKLIP